MAMYGLLIDYEFCTGCHSCEVACKKRFDLPKGQFGIRLQEDKPWQLIDGSWEMKYLPVPTKLCDMCMDRIEQSKAPICVQSCCAHVMDYGTPQELAAKAEAKGSKVAVFLP